MTLIEFANIVEANGKTVRQNNHEKTHNIPIDTLVEYEYVVKMANGTQLSGVVQGYVWAHTRDCDGTPLYSVAAASVQSVIELLGYNFHSVESYLKALAADRSKFHYLCGLLNLQYEHGYNEASLRVVNQ